MMRPVHWALAGILLLPGCSGEYTGPVSGILNLSLASSQGDEGAVLFTVSGGPVDTVESDGHEVHFARITPSTFSVIVAGDLGPGIIARIRIPDNRQASLYTASVGQVALRSTYSQRDPAGYTVSLAP